MLVGTQRTTLPADRGQQAGQVFVTSSGLTFCEAKLHCLLSLMQQVFQRSDGYLMRRPVHCSLGDEYLRTPASPASTTSWWLMLHFGSPSEVQPL